MSTTNKKNDGQILYKYRSLKNFKRFIDILVNNRLYATSYNRMNDYMEGHYLYESSDDIKKIIAKIKDKKNQLKICSLSKDPKNDVMLAHYADSGRGIIVGVELFPRQTKIQKNINYIGMQNIELNDITNIEESAKKILTYKTESWAYEKEVRIFTKLTYIKINIKEIIFGPKIFPEDKKLIKDLIAKMNLKIELIDYRDKK